MIIEKTNTTLINNTTHVDYLL